MNQLLLAILVAMVGAGGFWTFLQWSLEKIGKKTSKQTKLDNIANTINEIKETQDSMLDSLESTKDLSLSTARERINILCNEYVKLGYIPYEEYPGFISLGKSYLDAGGNSDVKEKFNKCKDYEVR